MNKIIQAFVLILLFSTYAMAIDGNFKTSNVPTKINSDSMNYNSEKNFIEFTGKVHVEREEFTLWADTLFVYLKENKEKVNARENSDGNTSVDPFSNMKSGDIEKIVAQNNVRMKYNTNIGEAKKVTYFTDKELLIMQGNPLLKDGKNSIKGEEIRYFLKENRSEVIGGKKRVEAFFSSD